MVNDSPLPQDDEDFPGRDYQFQLYLAAICHKAGLVPIRYDEPDIVCTLEGMEFGIATKRVKSQSMLAIGKHLKKAVKQLADQSLPGIIAVDLTLSRNPKNAPVMSRMQGQLFPVISDARSRQFYEQHKERIGRWIAGVHAKGILFVEFSYSIKKNDRWGHDCMFFWMPASASRDADPL